MVIYGIELAFLSGILFRKKSNRCLIRQQSKFVHVETSLLINYTNQPTGFIMIAGLVVKWLTEIINWHLFT